MAGSLSPPPNPPEFRPRGGAPRGGARCLDHVALPHEAALGYALGDQEASKGIAGRRPGRPAAPAARR